MNEVCASSTLCKPKGKILGHNIAGTSGQRLLRKGKPLTDEDLEKLRALGRTSVYVAEMEPDDVDENQSGAACCRGHLWTRSAYPRRSLRASQPAFG